MKSEKQKKNPLQCGSCTFLVRDKVFEAKCGEIGKIPSSRGCGSHLPDAYALVKHDGDEKLNKLFDISSVISTLTTTELQVLAGLLLREKITRKNGFKFLEKVYVRLSGNSNVSYLNDFTVGYVLDATSSTVRIIGENGSVTISAINDDESLTLYKTARFASLRSEMVQANRLRNPRLTDKPVRQDPFADAIMPLDSVDDKFLHGKNTKKVARDDLTGLVRKLGRGLFKQKKAVRFGEDGEIEISHE